MGSVTFAPDVALPAPDSRRLRLQLTAALLTAVAAALVLAFGPSPADAAAHPYRTFLVRHHRRRPRCPRRGAARRACAVPHLGRLPLPPRRPALRPRRVRARRAALTIFVEGSALRCVLRPLGARQHRGLRGPEHDRRQL